jgi:hypothetical protein
MKNIILLVIVLWVALSSLAQEQTQQLAVPGGQAAIVDFKGDVAIQAADQSAITAQRGLVLNANSTVETRKGSVLLQLSDGSQILVKSKTRVVITVPEQNKGHWFDLMIGSIKAKIQKHPNEAPFRLGTPTAVITVRGTEFTVDVDKKRRTSVHVSDGIVEFASLAAPDQPVFIRPGFGSRALPDRPAERPQEMNRGFDDRSGNSRDSSERGDSGRDSGDRSGERSGDRDSHSSTSPDSSDREQSHSHDRPD